MAGAAVIAPHAPPRRRRPEGSHRTARAAAAGCPAWDLAPLPEFREAYNATWLVERHGLRPPNAVRRERLSPEAHAA